MFTGENKMPVFAPSTGGLFGAPAPSEKRLEEKLEEKKPVERQDNPPNLIFGPSTIAPIAGSLFDTATPAPATGGLFGTVTRAPATGGLFGTSGAKKLPPTSIFDV